MRRQIAIFKAVTKNWLRSRSGLFFSFIFPVILLLLFGAIFGGGGGTHYSLQIQNKDITQSGVPTKLSQAFIDALNNTKALNIRLIPPKVDTLSYVKNQTGFFGEDPRVLIIPSGFQSDLLNGSIKERLFVVYETISFSLKNLSNIPPEQKQSMEQGLNALNKTINIISSGNATIIYLYVPGDQGAGIVRGIIGSVANSFNYGLIGAKPFINFSDETYSLRNLRPVDYYIPGYIGAFMMTNGVIGLTNVASEFKRRGLIKRLSITPLSKLDWIIGNILSQTLLAITLTIIMILLGIVLFNVSIEFDPITLLSIFVGAVLFSGIGMLLAGLVKDPEAASGLGNAVAFPMMFLSGTFWPIDIMPQFLQLIARLLPLTYFSDALRDSMLLGNSYAALINTTILGILAILFILLGTLATRWKER